MIKWKYVDELPTSCSKCKYRTKYKGTFGQNFNGCSLREIIIIAHENKRDSSCALKLRENEHENHD